MGKNNLKNGEATRFKAGKEQAEIARKGGIASGKSKRRKKTIKECAALLMSMSISEEDYKNIMRSMGIKNGDMTNAMIATISMFKKAVSGDVNAFRALMDAEEKAPRKEMTVEIDPLSKALMGIAKELENNKS